jgi:hypothetical protein
MSIEIQKPELEALILERMRAGAFTSVEDVLLEALKSSPLPTKGVSSASNDARPLTGADIVAAFQASPYKDIDLEPARAPMPVRETEF